MWLDKSLEVSGSSSLHSDVHICADTRVRHPSLPALAAVEICLADPDQA